MIVKKVFKCKKCGHTAEYSSDKVEYDHLNCKGCGKPIYVSVNLDETNADYVNVKGTIMRTDPKVHMSKKERRRMRNENNLD